MDRLRNAFGEPPIPENIGWEVYESRALQRRPVILGPAQRKATLEAIRETCALRSWELHAVNIRTNHGHVVVKAAASIDVVLTAFKANATRRMRLTGAWSDNGSPWSRGGSRRYIWTPLQLSRAIRYVIDGQGVDLD